MVAYRDLMLTLILLFTFLSLLMSPAIFFYKKGGALQHGKGWELYSLGNMGYSSVQCSNVPFDLNKITLSCPYGVISQIFHFGINPQGMKDKDACSPKEDNKVCNDALNPGFITALNSNLKSEN